MIKKKVILVIFHEMQPPHFNEKYMLRLFIERWLADGHRVEIVYGTNKKVEADLAILHIDLSVVPQEYLDFAQQYPLHVNASIGDIRKSVISKNRLCFSDPYEGPAIVKTIYNAAGAGERYCQWQGDKNYEFELPIDIRNQKDYKIYSSLSDVPKEVFDCPHLIVEKFLPEIHNGLYYLREIVFCRDVCFNLLEVSKDPIFFHGKVRLDLAEPPPQEVLEMREDLRIDYGKIDFVINNGKTIIFDVNKTPGRWDEPIELEREWAYKMAQGLYNLF